MGTFNTKAILKGDPSLIPAIAERICQEFAIDGYEIKNENLISGGADISVAKGNLFKAALGMKTALKITLIPLNNGISFEAGVGIFGQQAIPTIIMWFFAWPVLITQIWGLVQQSKLDDKALSIARSVIDEQGRSTAGNYPYGNSYSSNAGYAVLTSGETGTPKFCTNCGTKMPAGARFCPNCGSPLK